MDVLSERMQGMDVGGDGVIREVPRHHLLQPLSLLCNRIVPPAFQLVADVPQRPSHTLALGIPAQQESAIATLRADVSESEKVEGFRPSLAPLCTTFGRVLAKFDQAGLLHVESQRE